jgi:nicotinamide mononucleotide (NMN) deamidase PncC
VYIALASVGEPKVDEHRFLGDRGQVRRRASQAALDMVRRFLIS